MCYSIGIAARNTIYQNFIMIIPNRRSPEIMRYYLSPFLHWSNFSRNPLYYIILIPLLNSFKPLGEISCQSFLRRCSIGWCCTEIINQYLFPDFCYDRRVPQRINKLIHEVKYTGSIC